MRGGAGEKQGTSSEKIMAGVHRADLRFKMDSWTPGDGNCFPRAVRQQCQRLAVEITSINDHRDLRRKVTRYMLESKDRLVVDMRRRWEELEVRWSWESYWQRMARDTEWVEEPFIWATAWFLNRDIWIVWDTATPQSPLSFFSGDKDENNSVCPGVPLIIGHHTDTHYQSLLPEGDPVGNSFDTRRYAAEVNKTLEKFGQSHQRKSRLKRKEPQQEGGTDFTILKYGPGKPGVEVRNMQDGGVEYRCLLCQSQQKQIASHIEKSHASMFENAELVEFQVSLKKFAQAVFNQKRAKTLKEADPEGFKKAKRESESKRILKRMAEDPEPVKQNNRKRKNKCVAKQKKENPKKVKGRKKRENDARRADGERQFKGEQKYGHIFPCACCHTWKSRDQVVELNQQQADKIEGKAREYHQTLQVNSFIHIHTLCIKVKIIMY